MTIQQAGALRTYARLPRVLRTGSAPPGTLESACGSIKVMATAASLGKQSIEDVYRSETDRLQRLAYLMTGSLAVAEELVQEAFLRLHQRWDDVVEPPAYVHTVLVNLCLRWRRRTATRPDETVRSDELVTTTPEVDETWRLMEQLPEDQRVVLVLRYYEDLSAAEIARIVGCSPITVRTRIHRALTRLRKDMTR
jgi:RNA polymerase sigma-70 factor (sigma-E family)